MPLLHPDRYAELLGDVNDATRPATELERWFASEIAYASWELERVRANSGNTAAESHLSAAYGRATRNWNRARKELAKLQTARIPQPKLAGPVVDHAIDLIKNGVIVPTALRICAEQEAR